MNHISQSSRLPMSCATQATPNRSAPEACPPTPSSSPPRVHPSDSYTETSYYVPRYPAPGTPASPYSGSSDVSGSWDEANVYASIPEDEQVPDLPEGAFLQTQSPSSAPCGLASLPDPVQGDPKPSPTVNQLIAAALYNGPLRSLEICEAISRRYGYYSDPNNFKHLKNTVRHHLSKTDTFVRSSKLDGMKGKGGLWRLEAASGTAVSQSSVATRRSPPRPLDRRSRRARSSRSPPDGMPRSVNHYQTPAILQAPIASQPELLLAPRFSPSQSSSRTVTPMAPPIPLYSLDPPMHLGLESPAHQVSAERQHRGEATHDAAYMEAIDFWDDFILPCDYPTVSSAEYLPGLNLEVYTQSAEDCIGPTLMGMTM